MYSSSLHPHPHPHPQLEVPDDHRVRKKDSKDALISEDPVDTDLAAASATVVETSDGAPKDPDVKLEL